MSENNNDGNNSVPKESLKKIPTTKFARSLKLASLSTSIGASRLGHKIGTLFSSSEERADKDLLNQIQQAAKITKSLSELKGAAMKLGQILSLHGSHFFPKEVTAILAQLQSQSVDMDFSIIQNVLNTEVKSALESGTLTNINPKPIAAASIGQVHEGTYHDESQPETKVAIKIQYPGVADSIDSDIDSLAALINVVTKIPSISSFDPIIDEIKEGLKLETDYLTEGKNLEIFREHFIHDKHIIIPIYFQKASSKHVLTSEFLTGITVQEFANSTASQAARDFLGAKYLEVFYEELFNLRKIQTDPNFGNYKIKWSFGIQEPKLILLDFGAIKELTVEFRDEYRKGIRACLNNDYDGVRDYALQSGILRPEDSKELVDMHWQLIQMFMEPFQANSAYDWAQSDLPERITQFMPKFILAFRLRPPPKDFVFLNRKVTGVYYFASAIKSKFNPRPLLERFAL